ncbi:MAG TPA: DUF5655 domain-containing protein [Candidatus Polarisedimenticolaceae bacterium]|nr:DUF5655 domain-containing protein [Candidatus Polarisedimenticolaceae bacterium]
MADPEKGLQTQLANIQKRSGKTLDQLYAVIRGSGLGKHGEIRDMLKADLGLGHGDANTLVHTYFKAQEAPGSSSPDEVLAAIYHGSKAGLRPIHDALMTAIHGFGPFEMTPKKGYVSLRRKKQFAMIGPASQTRVEVGLNMKGVPGTPRLKELPPGGMCQYKVSLTDAREVDGEVLGWIRRAYEGAGP